MLLVVPVLPAVFIAVLCTAITPPIIAQEVPKSQSDAPRPTAFFSGNVVEVVAEHVTVSRSILGKTPEKRTFLITPDTKVEGKLKEKSRVTVRYSAGDEGDVALSILVRDRPSKTDKKK